MDARTQEAVRSQLVERRGRLSQAVTQEGETADLLRLLREVDDALGRMNGHQFGRCLVCKEAVDEPMLVVHPTIQYCLCELSPEQQRHLQNDLDLASRVQWSLLPEPETAFDGWVTHFRYLPAGPVSGDYCDVVASPSGNGGGGLYFLVGDVSGKGVAASFVMAHLNALFRSLIETAPSVGSLLERANRMLIENRIASHYATMVCGRALPSGRIELGNAGHCPPLVVRGGAVEDVRATGLPIGLFGGRSYTVSEVSLEPGESLVLYTDGLTEATGDGGVEYGADRLAALLRASGQLPPAAMAAAALDDVARHRAGAHPSDDLTLLVLRRDSR